MNENYIKQLWEILNTRSLSQTDLASRLGVTFPALNRWLHGHAAPRQRHLQAIQKLYREAVAFPAVKGAVLKGLLEKTAKFKIRGLWTKLSTNQGLQEELILEHTYNSTSIEGTTFTKRETEAVIFDRGLIEDKSLVEHLEVTNHAAALKALLKKEIRGPVSEALIRRLHGMVMQGIREDAGNYSKHSRMIRGLPMALTHPRDIPEEMARLIRDWSRKKAPTLLDIAEFHAAFELIHPFGDGNGRVGRLIMVLQCLERDIPPLIVETSRKGDYYDVLEYAQKTSSGPFLEFLVQEVERTHKICRRFLRIF